MNKITRSQAEERLALPVLSLEEAINKLDKEYDLCYVNYKDCIEDPKTHQEIINNGYPEWDSTSDWMCDNQWDAANEIMKELFNEVDIEDDEDDIRMEIMERDISNPFKQLIKNTRSIAVYYELGLETSGIYQDGDNPDEDIKAILKLLKTNKKHESYKNIQLMCDQASYGGSLAFIFDAELEDFYEDSSKDKKYITFKDPYLAIIDRWNGSGDFTKIKGEFTLPNDRKQLIVDEAAEGYSFLGKVFGCSPSDVACHYDFSDKPKGKLLS